jgi:hypothetical protein
VLPFRKRNVEPTIDEPTCDACGKLVPKVSMVVHGEGAESQASLPQYGIELVYIVLRCTCGAKIRIRDRVKRG